MLRRIVRRCYSVCMQGQGIQQENVARGWLRLLVTAAVVWIILALFGQLFAGNVRP